MQKYQEKPIPVVLRDEAGRYKVNQEALDLFTSIEGKLAIISVAGVYRTGKSFLLNTMLLNCKNGFAVGPTVNPKTKGIWVWGKPLIFKNDKDEIINVLVLDSEGLGSTQEDVNHDLRLFSITLLLSSAFIYNTVGAIDESAIDRLGLVLRLCEHLKNDSFNDFPDFYWILRDFSLELVDKNNNTLTTKAYLENCLSNQPNDSEYRNKIRQSIKTAFEVRNCYTFFRPLTDEQSLQNLDKMQLQDLRAEFVEQVISFRKNIFSNLRVKSIKGREIKGHMLSDLLNIYVQCINSDKLPVIESGWEQLCLKELHEVLYEIEQSVAKRVREMKERLPRSKKQLIKQQQQLMEQFQQIFAKKLKNNDKAKEYFNSVSQIINKQLKGIEQEMKVNNTNETKAFVRNHFESIEKKLKQSEFKSMGQLVKQFQMFYEFYRKKCPYKDEIETGLELLMKKFSDCSLILYKNTISKKDQEIQQLRKQMEKVVADYSAREEKLRQEKNNFQDTNAKLQANINDLTTQNDELTRLIEQLEAKLDIAENMNNASMQEQLSHENITLKKKIMDMEDRQRELDCLHSQQINTLKQQVLLKNNELENNQKQKMQLLMKYEQLESTYKGTKERGEQKILQLISQLESVNQKSNSIEKVLRQKLVEKQQQIEELEKTIELKNEEIVDNNNKTTLENSILTEMTLQQERKILQERQRELLILKKQHEQVKQSLSKRVNQLELELSNRQTQYKISKLQLEQEKALLTQKIQFIKKQSEQRHNKNQSFQAEITNYMNMIDQKDQTIQELNAEIEQLKNYGMLEGEQIQKRILEMADQLQAKNQYIKGLESEKQAALSQLTRRLEEKIFKIEEMEIMVDKSEEETKKMAKQNAELRKSKQQREKIFQEEIQTMRSENQKQVEQQKRNAELSLVQLKNFYEMQKQRLEKRLLQQRKKYEYNQANSTQQIRNKYLREIKTLSEANNELSMKFEELSEQMTKMQNQYEIKIMGLEEDLEGQRKSFENKYELAKRKLDDAVDELAKTEKQYEQERISFVKRIQGLSFEISRKEKEIMQINAKKESLEATIGKKDSQIQSIRKTMNQQIESSLKKVGQTQAKYQKINEEYSNYRIQVQKQNALLKQRNQFLNTRLSDLTREKDSGSSKNLEKIERNKITELKQQLDRQKSENMSLEAKIENLRKTEKETSTQYKKQINEFQKENSFLKQRIEIYEAKISELQIKINQKTEQFKKEVDQMRSKFYADRTKMQADIDAQKQKINQIEDEKNSKIYKLQKDLALAQDKVSHAQMQRDANKKDYQQVEKRLQNALNQIKKNSQKSNDASMIKKASVDKRYSNQLELMKLSSKVKQEDLQQSNKKLKEEVKTLRDKNFELQQKILRMQKSSIQEKNLTEQIERIRRQKQQLISNHRKQLARQVQQSRRKCSQLQKRIRQLQKQSANFHFNIQKQRTKAQFQKNQLTTKIKQLQQNLEELRNSSSKTQISKSKLFSMSSSDLTGTWR